MRVSCAVTRTSPTVAQCSVSEAEMRLTKPRKFLRKFFTKRTEIVHIAQQTSMEDNSNNELELLLSLIQRQDEQCKQQLAGFTQRMQDLKGQYIQDHTSLPLSKAVQNIRAQLDDVALSLSKLKQRLRTLSSMYVAHTPPHTRPTRTLTLCMHVHVHALSLLVLSKCSAIRTQHTHAHVLYRIPANSLHTHTCHTLEQVRSFFLTSLSSSSPSPPLSSLL